MKKCILKCFKSSSKNPQDSLKSQSILKTEPENPDLDLKQSSIKIPSIENENLDFLIKSLKNLPIFRGLQKTELINSSCFFRRLTFSQNKEIISEGDEGNFLYILITGACKVIKNQSEVSTLKPGSVFGELSLLTNQKRKTTVKTVTQSTLYALDKLSFKSIFSVVQAREQESFEQMFKASPFFASLTSEQKKKIFEISFFGKFKEKEKICSEGEEALFVYFLLRGRVDVLVENRVVGTIEENRLFGEISLFNPFAALRAATIISKETCEVFLISINELILILGPDYRKVLLKNIVFNCMMTENLLNFLPIELIHHIANSFNFQEFSKESLVINSAVELDSTIVVVCFGKIFSMKKKFRSYSLIGLKNLKHLKVGTGKFKSEGFSIVGRISFEKVSEIIGCEERNLLEYLGKLAELKSVRFLNGLEFRDLDFVLRKVEREQFERGEVIFNDGCDDEKVYIVDTGAVGVFEEESFLFRYDRKSVFGEDCLVGGVREKTMKALTQVSCLSLKKDDMINIINDKMIEYVYSINKISKFFTLNHLTFFKLLSQQENRDWYLSYHPEKDMVLTSEVIYKSTIKTFPHFQQILNQKSVITQLDHPHIPRYIRTLSDSKRVYFFYQSFNSLSLRNSLSLKMSEKVARFLIMTIFSSVNYLHNKNILHRNITPENIFIDGLGYAKLTGFQFAKQTARSYSLLDTQIEYRAKEVILGKGYSKDADLWSCGVILYEMIHGKLPFGIGKNDGYDCIVRKIINRQVGMFSDRVSEKGKRVLNGLLHGNPDKRMKLEEVLKSKWADCISFDDIFYSKAKAEFIPGIKEIDECMSKNLTMKKKSSKNEEKVIQEFDWDLYF